MSAADRTAIVVMVVWGMLLYGAGAFVECSLDPARWAMVNRAFVVAMWLFFGVPGALATRMWDR